MDLRNRKFLQKLKLRVEKDYTALCGKTTVDTNFG